MKEILEKIIVTILILSILTIIVCGYFIIWGIPEIKTLLIRTLATGLLTFLVGLLLATMLEDIEF